MSKFLRVVSTVALGSVMMILGTGSLDLYDDYDYVDRGSYRDFTSYTTYPIGAGFVKDGITIEAVDGSFVLSGGESFTPPFTSSLWPQECPYNINTEEVLSQVSEARSCGAKDVRVSIEGLSKPLYGVLAFNPRISSSFGPSAQSYLIQLRADKVQSAASGNTSVNFEYQKFKKTTGYSNESARSSEEKYAFGWVLWLSSFPM